jgi:tRNA A37 methylthiotransferase MiaB
VRGRSRSAQPEWVVEQVRHLSERYREVVLSGINLGRWGRDLEGHMRLADLVRAHRSDTAEGLVAACRRDLEQFRTGAGRTDDVTVMAIRRM